MIRAAAKKTNTEIEDTYKRLNVDCLEAFNILDVDGRQVGFLFLRVMEDLFFGGGLWVFGLWKIYIIPLFSYSF